ncbi:hypothetical protein D3C76_1873490 [compost metagenome]
MAMRNFRMSPALRVMFCDPGASMPGLHPGAWPGSNFRRKENWPGGRLNEVLCSWNSLAES